ncbi:MAG: hypothetical protein WC824_13635, partial [Bacteroidota bacterium]
MKYIPLLLLVSLLSCDDQISVPLPAIDAKAELAGAAALSMETLNAMEGVYEVVEGQSLLGREAVVKRIGKSVSFFTDRDAGYCVLECGAVDSSLVFAGYWRKQTGVEAGTFRAMIGSARGGKGLMRGDKAVPGNVVILGEFGNPDGKGTRPLQLVYRRPLFQGDR